jgi:hypothetical protein
LSGVVVGVVAAAAGTIWNVADADLPMEATHATVAV